MVTTCQEAVLYLRGGKKKVPKSIGIGRAPGKPGLALVVLVPKMRTDWGWHLLAQCYSFLTPVLQFPEEKHPDC